jgi:transposase
MIELAWFWLRHQPDSVLSRWFHAWVVAGKGRVPRIAIVALARKLLVALWRYVTQGIVPEGAGSRRHGPDCPIPLQPFNHGLMT